MAVERLIPGEGLLWEAARIISGNILLVLCAHIVIAIPGSPVPFTGQTFGVLLLALLLGARRAAMVMALYLLEGAAGLPVFQPLGLPGVARLIGPTAGYLWMYPLAAWVTGRLAERVEWQRGRSVPATARTAAAVLAGHALILAGGWAWLAAVPHLDATGALVTSGWGPAFAVGVAPFLLDAVLKTVLILAAARGIGRMAAAD
jgi:biotin transport system substrate-specific component